MATLASFHVQVASVMEVLTKTALAEITKLVDDASAKLRLEMFKSQKENEALRSKLLVMEGELRAARGCGEGTPDSSLNIAFEVKVCDESSEVQNSKVGGEGSVAVERLSEERLSTGPAKDELYLSVEKKGTVPDALEIKYESEDCPLLAHQHHVQQQLITTFTSREEKKANYAATVLPKVTPHLKVLSDAAFPEAPALPSSLPPPDRPQVQYQHLHHEAGKRRGEKRRLFVDKPEPVDPANRPTQPTASSSSTQPPAAALTPLQPRPPALCTFGPPPVSAAPILLVLPAQPQAPSVLYRGPSCSQTFVPPAPTVKAFMPNKSSRPCGACHVPNCGGQRKRYTPSKDKIAGSMQKIFSYCPSTRKSTTSGFDNVVYDNFEHFKSVVDAELDKRRNV